MNPFDVIGDISLNKKRVITEDNERDYSPFMTNRGLSYFRDTIFYAQEMNKLHHVDKKMQFDYLFNSIRKSKRFSKWSKKENAGDIQLIADYFGYSWKKAEQAIDILTKEQIAAIRDSVARNS